MSSGQVNFVVKGKIRVSLPLEGWKPRLTYIVEVRAISMVTP